MRLAVSFMEAPLAYQMPLPSLTVFQPVNMKPLRIKPLAVSVTVLSATSWILAVEPVVPSAFDSKVMVYLTVGAGSGVGAVVLPPAGVSVPLGVVVVPFLRLRYLFQMEKLCF